MESIVKIYKALELYELSPREWKIKKYFAYSDNRKQYAVFAFIINSDDLKKEVINFFLQYINDTVITWKILLPSNNYVVGLFDIVNKTLIDGTLIFGRQKTILEEFNKKISSKRYADYFQNNQNFLKELNNSFDLTVEENIDFWDIESKTNINSTSQNQNITFEKYSINDLKGNLQNSRIFLQSINKVSTKDRIKKMWEIAEAFETYRTELEKENVSDEVIDDILNLSFGKALELQEIALNIKAQRIKISNLSKFSKREREAILQDM